MWEGGRGREREITLVGKVNDWNGKREEVELRRETLGLWLWLWRREKEKGREEDIVVVVDIAASTTTLGLSLAQRDENEGLTHHTTAPKWSECVAACCCPLYWTVMLPINV